MEEQSKPLGPQIGGTAIAIVVAIIVILVVSSVVSFLMSLFQYYIANVREEVALFIGNIAGGIASVHAARSACDATIKHYSSKSIFSMLALLIVLLAIFDLSRGWEGDAVYRLAFLISTLITAYIVFWKEDF